jgi:hypothetical protein
VRAERVAGGETEQRAEITALRGRHGVITNACRRDILKA